MGYFPLNKESSLKTTSLADCDRALDLAKRGLLVPRYTKFKLSELPTAVNLLRTGNVAGRAVVDLWA
jgi:propanol-preferring alcohol dehydrogenase